MSDQKEVATQESLTGPHRLTMDKWITCAPFEELLQIKIISAAEGKAHLQMPFLFDFAQGAGLMHGGALVSLGDTALVMAIKTILEPATHFATIELTSRFLQPVVQGAVTAHARIISVDGREVCGEALLIDYQGTEVMKLKATYKIARDARIRTVHFADLD
ncbi:MAG: PaaI family thioesterase [Desulfobulbaceae bacterium]|nr:MAG: PaaI family thioesterase [Desulfobulbaceae bacterium]